MEVDGSDDFLEVFREAVFVRFHVKFPGCCTLHLAKNGMERLQKHLLLADFLFWSTLGKLVKL